ncbi:MAG: stage V sporulation T C-terminal domain-containing protein [Lachnospiraceae bacterium]
MRRIDDLGRVVVPKEIRRTLRIREGDPLEIFTDKEGEIILKKYSPMGELGTLLEELCESIAKTTKAVCAVCDRDCIIAASGTAQEVLLEKTVSKEVKEIMEQRKCYRLMKKEKPIYLTEELEFLVLLSYPIVTAGDVSGAIFYISKDEKDTVGEGADLLANAMSVFLSEHLGE